MKKGQTKIIEPKSTDSRLLIVLPYVSK